MNIIGSFMRSPYNGAGSVSNSKNASSLKNVLGSKNATVSNGKSGINNILNSNGALNSNSISRSVQDNNSAYDRSMAICNSTQLYGESLRTQRQQSQSTSLNMKKLKYQFKNISSKILRSKTSVAAKQVAGQAKREVMRLKNAKQSGNYDADEIDAAITHAKAMERIAKKKVKHLEQEEMAKVSDKAEPTGSSIDENDIVEAAYDKIEEDVDKLVENAEESVEAYSDEISKMLEDCSDEMAQMLEECSDEMSQMLEEYTDELYEMMEEMGLDELADMLHTSKELSPEELKELKLKHRNKEMKDIVKADAKYLKAMFDHYEKMSGGSAAGGTAGTSANVSGGVAAVASAVVAAPVECSSVINIAL